MRILIEEYQYNVADVKDILQGIDALENVEGRVSIHYVGYYYNTLLKDCVFILPKVLLKDVMVRNWYLVNIGLRKLPTLMKTIRWNWKRKTLFISLPFGYIGL